MGDRANIILKQEEGDKIYLYTHWGGYKIKQVVADALDRGRDRWSDEPYLNRIIFSELVKEDIEGLSGYGLSTSIDDGEDNCVEVDIANKKVDGISFEKFIEKYKGKD